MKPTQLLNRAVLLGKARRLAQKRPGAVRSVINNVEKVADKATRGKYTAKIRTTALTAKTQLGVALPAEANLIEKAATPAVTTPVDVTKDVTDVSTEAVDAGRDTSTRAAKTAQDATTSAANSAKDAATSFTKSVKGVAKPGADSAEETEKSE